MSQYLATQPMAGPVPGDPAGIYVRGVEPGLMSTPQMRVPGYSGFGGMFDGAGGQLLKYGLVAGAGYLLGRHVFHQNTQRASWTAVIALMSSMALDYIQAARTVQALQP